MVLGDARRQLVRLPDAHFDVLILDGFCSDAIPVHLLTREAFHLYFQKLAPGGVLAVHISNNHLDLPPLVARIARREFDSPLSVRYSHDMASEDERADGKQRDALATILYGGETDKGATHWWVYRAMSSTVHPPIFKRIEFDVDIEHRKARIVIPDVLESTARPIQSPATGAEHRVRINLPNGIEFDLAEIGSGTTKTMASIALDLEDTYCHFTALRQSGKGVVRSR